MSRVLDASAVLAYLHREPGWEEVRTMIGDACISAIAWNEVAQRAARQGFDAGAARTLLAELGLDIVPFTAEHAETAAHLGEETHGSALSLANRACLALAIERGLETVTADRAWEHLRADLSIRMLR
ncbi:MAG: type II toxin-antitoxin system VapC family toxin [Chromatiales bacterium]|jgi:PIN domain nuclease of toxin-antitoxin system|nr:type II toxin-antitoxin system VapC family toxin [Chromatiales bacterium]